MKGPSTMTKLLHYKGELISECQWEKGAHAGKWTIVEYHESGRPYADELCPHFRTLREAREYITAYANLAKE